MKKDCKTLNSFTIYFNIYIKLAQGKSYTKNRQFKGCPPIVQMGHLGTAPN